MFRSVQDPKALGSMIFARIIYAVNWLNVGAIFYLMSTDLGAGVSGLGTMTAAFYIGIGVMQVPGGVMAAKWGPKRVVVAGVFLSSSAALGTSLLSTVAEMSVLRFLVGAGMALVFAPGVVIVARLLSGGKSGIGVGLFNSAFDIGGLVALFGWVVVATLIGWRPSLALSGGLGVMTGVLVILFVPEDKSNSEFAVSREPLVRILLNKQLILLGFGTLGIGVANFIISGFMVYYLNDALSVEGTVAGLIASLVTVVPIFAAIGGGRVYDRVSKHKSVMILSLVGSALALVVAGVNSVPAAVACTVLAGIVSGFGFTFAFAGARDFNPSGAEYEGMAIAWVNSISLTGAFLPPVLFSYLVSVTGYSQAWLWSGALTLAFLVPVILMVEKWNR